MIRIIPPTAALSPSTPKPFKALDGSAPYTYSVAADGIGGTIDVDGVYTAPLSKYGTDTIYAVDSLGSSAEITVNVLSPLELLCDVIKNQLDLDDSHVYIWDQKIPEPTDFSLYVVASMVSCKPFSNTIQMDGSGGGVSAIQSTNFLAQVQIDIFSRGLDAMNRKEEVIMALKSVYAEQQQELNSFYISSIPTGFTNTSNIDGAAIPYRFSITVGLQYFIKKAQAVEYYDTFASPSLVTDS